VKLTLRGRFFVAARREHPQPPAAHSTACLIWRDFCMTSLVNMARDHRLATACHHPPRYREARGYGNMIATPRRGQTLARKTEQKSMVDHVVNYSSSDNLLEFLSDLGVPAFLADRENLIYSFNRTASHLEKIIGRSLLGMSLRELLPSVSFSGTNGYPAMDGHIEFHGKNFKVRFMPVNNGHVAMLLPSQSREELEKELAEARETLFDLDAAFNFSYDGIFITDGNAVGLRINESYSRVTGIENAQDMVGMTMQEAVKQGIVSESVSLLVLKNRKAMSTRPKVSRGKEILMTGTPVFNDEGEIVRVISNVRDISELLKLNKELEEVRQQSERYYSELLHLRSQQMSIGDCIANSLPMRKVVETALKI